ncbi:hypothetical protein VFPPC_17370 [Pochonia chlamydosporia 170]|uniref:Uncharacterized protein n=1 Tax=Pochonia chlamydosporia 170 TaxID=1380566 RepID=A0A219ARS8_METCM|nr:hypothetical protein VFPPC_17370 [Pochonia chlamydosporia 170]OWT43481.1 hypothetical protein VFPPC_17370 [Pochonia chlamydosporia 170]
MYRSIWPLKHYHPYPLQPSSLARTSYRGFDKLRSDSLKLSGKRTASVLITAPHHHLSQAISLPHPRTESRCETVRVDCHSTSMASDEDYMAFLDKANQDLDDGNAYAAKQSAQKKTAFKTMDEGSQAPKVIRDACQDAVYVTDADEPFEEVSLKWSGDGLPDESTFRSHRFCLVLA